VLVLRQLGGRIWKIGTAVGSSLWRRRRRRLGTRRGIFLEIEAVGTVGGCFVSQEECFQVGPGSNSFRQAAHERIVDHPL
jgi:hypothetical protein